jgi:hypothetical protein
MPQGVESATLIVDCNCGLTIFNSIPLKVSKNIILLLGRHYPEVK